MTEVTTTETAIRTMVDTFYARVREDAVLAPVFERMLVDKWESHMPRMYAFWTKVLLDKGEFQGNVFGKHMALTGIMPEHFTHWLDLFRATAVETLGDTAGAGAIIVAERIASSLQYGFFGEQRA